MAGVNIYEPSEVLFRRQLASYLGGVVEGDQLGFTALRLKPVTTAARVAMTNIEGLLVYDGDIEKAFIGTGSGWEEITST